MVVKHEVPCESGSPDDRYENREPPEAGAPPAPRAPSERAADADRPREYGGRKGPEPTRYGDWEKNGRCIDF